VKPRGWVCTICQKDKQDEDDWFLMIENAWDDRLKVLKWDDEFALQDGVYAACGPAHVQELAAHWMATGSLAHPFAQASEREGTTATSRPWPGWPLEAANSADVGLLGELAVHREALNRILMQNPESLVGVLEALVSCLYPPLAPNELGSEAETEEGTRPMCVSVGHPVGNYGG
jgi:hypothetical protein